VALPKGFKADPKSGFLGAERFNELEREGKSKPISNPLTGPGVTIPRLLKMSQTSEVHFVVQTRGTRSHGHGGKKT
jgi:hypothetical protein